MTYVGEDRFEAGMAAYFAQHAWGNTTLQDLIDALSASSGRDLSEWQRGWLETAGVDRLALERAGDGLELLGTGPAGDPRPQVLAIGAYRSNGDSLDRVAVDRIEVQGARTPVDLPADADFYLVNDDDLTFATGRPDPATRDDFFGQAAGLPTPLSRGVAVTTVWDMLLNGEATAAEVVTCVTGVLRRETSGSVIEPYLQMAADAAELWSTDAERAGLLAQVAETCRELATDPTRRVPALRIAARTAVDLDTLTMLQAEASDDVDLQWRILVRKSELGADVEEAVARLGENDPDPDSWVRAVAVKAASPDQSDKESVWQTVVGDRKVPVSDVGAVMSAFWRPGQSEVLAPYADKYLSLLSDLDHGGMIPAMVYTKRLFPVFGVGPEFVDRAVGAADKAAPVVRKSLVEHADIVGRMLRARG
jgi:aminopeptidase N